VYGWSCLFSFVFILLFFYLCFDFEKNDGVTIKLPLLCQIENKIFIINSQKEKKSYWQVILFGFGENIKTTSYFNEKWCFQSDLLRMLIEQIQQNVNKLLSRNKWEGNENDKDLTILTWLYSFLQDNLWKFGVGFNKIKISE
jgi:hypothetical protein